MKGRPHDEAMAEQLYADPVYAAELLAEVRRNGDPAELAILLRQLTKVVGQGSGGSSVEVERVLPPS
ncbi:transcriptional regulator [Pseudomonas daroniae]|uniref:Transcriptional regulator n=1 Tax=Phytopseudomonas daroniae TaxID=2487519 RepID=A0A4Q9QI77_9GAMM|nr:MULTISPECIES: transcriptional regulator [Pseudomonas]TBU72473.1 transcriptional regulator [Pseudomonas daroniae]TBU73787.1 transcriptional regulator [Pseudomonas daroniae]TBU79538.1 transcriptional regulator [Pseudomonas sp. FRB 228]TBU88231.1 transcriptional regulator [Pseudomonas daroniae]